MSYELTILEAEEMMDKGVEHTLREFSTLHTGKASPSMVENIQIHVTSYGSSMHLREIAAITTPDPRTIQIQPWDKSIIKDVEKGIQLANLGLNPAINGDILRVPVPELSGERRRDLVKMAQQIAEQGRVRIRHARREALDELKRMSKTGEISEDDFHRFEKDIQEETDKHIKDIDGHLQLKETELTTV